MKDGLDRTIDYLRLSVTNRCNLRCAYCMPPEWVCRRTQEEVCTLEELAELAAVCVGLGVRRIRLTGGEPLVRRGIVSLVEQLSGLSGLDELTMTTNGTLLTELAAPLRAAGLDRLNISLDTLRPERYRALTRGGSLEQVFAGIAAAEAAGFRDIRLNAVLLRNFNADELGAMARLAQERPWSVRFIELMPIGPGADMQALFLPGEAVLKAVPELRPLDRCGVARRYTAPDWAGTVGLITPMSCEFCSTCSRIRITADGRLKLCLHASEEIPLRGLHGAELAEAVLAAVQRKPARHSLSQTVPSQSSRRMHEIGG